MSARDTILAAVRSNRPAGDHPLVDTPRFRLPEPDGRQAKFVANLKAMGGEVLEAAPGQTLLETLDLKLRDAGIVCSAAPEVAGERDLAAVGTPADLADVDIAVVRAVLGVAETGSVLACRRPTTIRCSRPPPTPSSTPGRPPPVTSKACSSTAPRASVR
jgi:L-lactate dehydrogenase complex protein LldG